MTRIAAAAARAAPRHVGAALVLSLAWLATAATACAAGLDQGETLRTSQAAIGRTLGGYAFTTSDGRALTLEQLRGRPVVLSLVYTSCYYVCSGLTLHLRDKVRIARQALGDASFTVVTVGFDSRNDTPDRMRMYARERGVDLRGWYFASADAATIDRLTADAGFSWQASAKGFDHIAQTTIVDADGRVALQVYGDDFAAPLLVEPLKRLVWGRDVERGTLERLVDRVRLVCTIYDPRSGRYRFDYSLIVNIVSGSLALGMAAIAIIAAVRNTR